MMYPHKFNMPSIDQHYGIMPKLLDQYVTFDTSDYHGNGQEKILDRIAHWMNTRAMLAHCFPRDALDVCVNDRISNNYPNKWYIIYDSLNDDWQIWIEDDNLRTEFILTWK